MILMEIEKNKQQISFHSTPPENVRKPKFSDIFRG